MIKLWLTAASTVMPGDSGTGEVRVFIMLPTMLFLALGIVVLQIFLCRKGGKAGLALPGISMGVSLLMVLAVVLSYAMYTEVSGKVVVINNETGEITEQYTGERNLENTGDIGGLIFAGLSTFALSNIPTLVLLAVYWGHQGRRRKDAEWERMKALDLE